MQIMQDNVKCENLELKDKVHAIEGLHKPSYADITENPNRTVEAATKQPPVPIIPSTAGQSVSHVLQTVYCRPVCVA